jgi:hypothetical protein
MCTGKVSIDSAQQNISMSTGKVSIDSAQTESMETLPVHVLVYRNVLLNWFYGNFTSTCINL